MSSKSSDSVSSVSGIRLVDRDYKIMKEVDRWRVCLGRHICELAEFSGQRACDRRLKKLVVNKFLERKKYLYGVPYIYQVTHKGKVLINAPIRQDKIKLEQVNHDIIVLDTAIYIHKKFNITFKNMTTEKQLHMLDGFGKRKHQPDFTYKKDNETTCVEVELTLKAKTRLENNIKSNFVEYDNQIWIVPSNSKMETILKNNATTYPNIKIIQLEKITEVKV